MRPSSHQQRIRHAFNTAAHTYEANADWQKEIAAMIMQQIDQHPPHQKTIVDLGAGTGILSRSIATAYPSNHVIALDLAESMLDVSKHPTLLCADAMRLPLRDQSIDLVVSNLMLHWCSSLSSALDEQYRVLKPNSLLIFSVTGPQSLSTLKAAWQKVDTHDHLNVFPDQTQLKNDCQKSGFSLVSFDTHHVQKHYKTIYELMDTLKKTGVTNISEKRPRHLMGKQKMAELNAHYSNPTIYEAYTVVCRK